MADRFDALLAGLRHERALPERSRDTKAGDASLDAAIRDVSRAVDLVRDGRRRDALDALALVTYHATDSWSYASPLSAEVVACTRDLRRLVDRQFMREWAGDASRPGEERPRSSFEPTYEDLFVKPPRNALTRSRAALYTGGVVLVVVVATVVVTVLYARGALSVAGTFLAPVLAMAVLTIPLYWLGGQVDRRRRAVVRQLRELPSLIREELAVPHGTRTTGATDDSLRSALAQVERLLRTFVHGAEDDGTEGLGRLRRTAADWASRAPLAAKVARLDRAGRRLATTVRRGDRLARVWQQHGRPEDPRAVRWWDRWLIRFPAYSLLMCLFAYGLRQSDRLAMSEALVVAGAGILLVAGWQVRQQRRRPG